MDNLSNQLTEHYHIFGGEILICKRRNEAFIFPSDVVSGIVDFDSSIHAFRVIGCSVIKISPVF